MPARTWLFKSEPDVFSIDDLARAENQTTAWDGIRNYQARNFLRDEVQVNDLVLFHHSNANPPGIVGTARVKSAARPDPTAWENAPGTKGHDPKSRPEAPVWFLVDIQLESIFEEPLTLPFLKAAPELEGLELLRKGSRLSIQPVSEAHARFILAAARKKKKR